MHISRARFLSLLEIITGLKLTALLTFGLCVYFSIVSRSMLPAVHHGVPSPSFPRQLPFSGQPLQKETGLLVYFHLSFLS